MRSLRQWMCEGGSFVTVNVGQVGLAVVEVEKVVRVETTSIGMSGSARESGRALRALAIGSECQRLSLPQREQRHLNDQHDD